MKRREARTTHRENEEGKREKERGGMSCACVVYNRWGCYGNDWMECEECWILQRRMRMSAMEWRQPDDSKRESRDCFLFSSLPSWWWRRRGRHFGRVKKNAGTSVREAFVHPWVILLFMWDVQPSHYCCSQLPIVVVTIIIIINIHFSSSLGTCLLAVLVNGGAIAATTITTIIHSCEPFENVRSAIYMCMKQFLSSPSTIDR